MARGKPSKYPEIYQKLLACLSDPALEKIRRLPGERVFAEKFQCSHLTVRKSLRLLEQENRIHTIPGIGRFIGAAPERKSILPAGEGVVGFIFPDDEIYYYKLFAALEKTLSALNLHPVVHLTGMNAAKEDSILDFLEKLPAAALIAVPNLQCSSHYRKLTIPTVFFDIHPENSTTPYVVSDDYGGAEHATKFLLEKGHQKIAFIGGTEEPSSIARRDGYINTLLNAGIVPEKKFIKLLEPSRQWGFKAMTELLAEKTPPTAVFCSNDTIAAGVARAVMSAGLRLKNDIELVGFGNTVISEDLNISSVSQHSDKIAWALKEALHRMLTGKTPSPSVMIPTELIKR